MAQVENHNNFGTFKIEMVPEFNGKCDVANFIRDVNHIFDIHKPCEQLKVISLQNCIKGHALNAYHLTGGKLDTLGSICTPLYHQQQNKWYPQRCLLAHFEATLDFSRREFTCP